MFSALFKLIKMLQEHRVWSSRSWIDFNVIFQTKMLQAFQTKKIISKWNLRNFPLKICSIS